jgi:hypothetical protein
MFESLEDMSNYINNGSYQLMSSVRVSYIVIKKQKAVQPAESMVGGGDFIDFEEEYLKATNMDDTSIQDAGKKYKKHTRKRKRVRFSIKRSRKQYK